MQGLVVAAFGKRYEVELGNQMRISCVTRGKKTDLACGDVVNIKLTDTKEGVVESSQIRSSLLYRSSAFKSKILAANVTQIVIVLATQPSFYEALLNRCLVAAEAAKIKPVIVLNKCDLPDIHDAKSKLKLYESLGYEVVYITANKSITPLLSLLENHQSVLVGQSGMGKSTIINTLFPHQHVRTQEISEALDSGKHTTTAARLYHINLNSTLIDSPGLQEFGLNHLSNEEVELAFIEFKPYLGYCKYANCKHMHEPDCAVLAALKKNIISKARVNFYQELSKELSFGANIAK
jgi:ribosome biogenesis GTPase